MSQFANRKEQIEKDFPRKLKRALSTAGCPLNEQGIIQVKEYLKSAALVGGCEERGRALQLLRAGGDVKAIEAELISKGVLDVLGYDEARED